MGIFELHPKVGSVIPSIVGKFLRYLRLIIVIIAFCHGSLKFTFGKVPNTLIAKVMSTVVEIYWMKLRVKAQTTLKGMCNE